MRRILMSMVTLCSMVLVWQFVLAEPAETQVNQQQRADARPESVAKSADAFDVVMLKNGNRIEGLIVNEDDSRIVVKRSSGTNKQFYSAAINKNDIAGIQRLPTRVRASLQKREAERASQELAARQANETAMEQARAKQQSLPVETRGYLPANRAGQPIDVGDRLGVVGYGGYGGMGGMGGMRGGGMMGGYGGMMGGMGGMGGMRGGMMGGMGGMRGGMMGGGMMGGMMGGGPVFSNIMQLFMPVNHALVGEVEPVIGLTGQIGQNQRGTVAGAVGGGMRGGGMMGGGRRR